MTIERYKNNATTTLNGAINASVTTVTVADATQLPTLTGSDQFRIRVESEEMIVTGVSGNDLTVTRGAEGTTAAIHGNGATVTHNLTAASIQNLPGNFLDSEGDPANIGTAADGTSSYPARRDHIHAIADSFVTSRMLSLGIVENEVTPSETTTSTSYADLATTGPSVTTNPGITMDTLSLFGTDDNKNSLAAGICITALSVGGDTPGDSNTKRQAGTSQMGAVTLRWHAALTTNTSLQMKYRVTSGTGTWDGRRLLAVGLS